MTVTCSSITWAHAGVKSTPISRIARPTTVVGKNPAVRRINVMQPSHIQVNLVKCWNCRTLHEELVAKQPHSGLIQDGVLRQLNGFEKRYTCTLCATRWRRFMPDRTRGAKKYFWMSRDA